MKQLVIFPKGALSAKDKERLSKEGYLAIESEDPSRIVMPMPTLQLGGDDLLLAALQSMNAGSWPSARVDIKAAFTDRLSAILADRKAKATA